MKSTYVFIYLFIYLQSVIVCLFFILFTASSLLNWSYQNNKACCSVLVDENQEIIPSSKTTISETNLSTSSKPKPSSGGNNYFQLRKRRHVVNSPHAILNNRSITLDDSVISSSTNKHDNDSKYEHASTSTVLAPLHDMILNFSTSDVSLINVDYTTTTTNNPKQHNFTTVQGPEDGSEDNKFETTTSDFNEYDSNEDLDDISNEDPFFDNDPLVKISEIVEIENARLHDNLTVGELQENTSPKRKKDAASDGKLENIQQDDPVSSYESGEIEMVNSSNITTSSTTTMKSKIAYDGTTMLKEKFELKDQNVLNNEVKENLTDESSKELTDYNLAAAENRDYVYDLKKKSNFNIPNENLSLLNLHENVDFYNTDNTTNNKKINSEFINENRVASSNIKIIEVPPLSPFNSTTNNNGNNKRVTINVTIATEPNDSGGPNTAQNLYVLSVSIPTIDNSNESPSNNNININTQPEPYKASSSAPLKQLSQQKEFIASDMPVATTNVTNNHLLLNASSDKSFGFWGGECQCSCPCLDDYENFADDNDTAIDYIEDVEKILNSSVSFEDELSFTGNKSGNNIISTTTTDPTTTSDDWITTNSACQDTSTKNPPTPTILILEGRISSV